MRYKIVKTSANQYKLLELSTDLVSWYTVCQGLLLTEVAELYKKLSNGNQ